MKQTLAIAALALLVAGAAQAQETATINATADVQVAIAVTGSQNLQFGAAFPNTTRTIATNDAANAGYFSVIGANNAEVNVTFPSLPTYLAFGANQLPVTFTAAYATTFAGTKTAIPNLAATTTQRLDATNGTFFVFVGGSVSPTTEPNGTYQGTVTLNVAYTGN